MSKLTKLFCVATAGATCDGRVIEDSWIDEMAETYDPKTYGARVNMEHIKGFSADPPFNAYGDVVAVEAREVELSIGGKTEKRKALFAQIDGNDGLVGLSEKRQKVYPSIEVNPNFAGTGKAYLQGLAVTDNPASLGTEVLEFAAKQGEDNFLNARKKDPGNYFSAAGDAVVIEFEDGKPSAEGSAAGMFAAATDFFKNFGKQAPAEGEQEEEEQPSPPAPANDNMAALSAAMGQGFEKLSQAVAAGQKEITDKVDQLRGDHDALKASIETTDNGAPRRPAATGQNQFAATDC